MKKKKSENFDPSCVPWDLCGHGGEGVIARYLILVKEKTNMCQNYETVAPINNLVKA